MGKRRKLKQRTAVAAVGTAGIAGISALTSAAPAGAASVSVWEKVAACESSGNWKINTGNGFYGGLQFTSGTWKAYGGLAYASQANKATKAQQILIAEKVLKGQGPGAWPVCSVKAGLRRGGPVPQVSAHIAAKVPSRPSSTVSAASRAVSFATAQLGKPYVYGAVGPNAYDCSGLTSAAWRSAGVSIPRTAAAQLHGLRHVPVSQVRAGDLIVYKGGGHVAIYIGHGRIIEAPRPGASVRTAPWRSGWYGTHFTAVVRPYGKSSPVSAPKATTPKVETHHRHTTPPKPAPGQVHGESEGLPKVVTPSPSKAAVTHTVVPGDTLWHLARLYRVPGGWPAIFHANPGLIHSAHWIFPGQVFVIPQ